MGRKSEGAKEQKHNVLMALMRKVHEDLAPFCREFSLVYPSFLFLLQSVCVCLCFTLHGSAERQSSSQLATSVAVAVVSSQQESWTCLQLCSFSFFTSLCSVWAQQLLHQQLAFQLHETCDRQKSATEVLSAAMLSFTYPYLCSILMSFSISHCTW